MDYEAISKADLVLDKCGRAVPPPGYKYVDLPCFIPMRSTFQPADANAFQIRQKNNYLTDFVCMGFIVEVNYPIRVRWPNGRYLSQNPSWPAAAGSPMGQGSNLLALSEFVTIQSGANITVEVSGL